MSSVKFFLKFQLPSNRPPTPTAAKVANKDSLQRGRGEKCIIDVPCSSLVIVKSSPLQNNEINSIQTDVPTTAAHGQA